MTAHSKKPDSQAHDSPFLLPDPQPAKIEVEKLRRRFDQKKAQQRAYEALRDELEARRAQQRALLAPRPPAPVAPYKAPVPEPLWMEPDPEKRKLIQAQKAARLARAKSRAAQKAKPPAPAAKRTRRPPSPLTYQGETLSHAEWAARLGLDRSTIAERLKRGLPVEEVLTPKQPRKVRVNTPKQIARYTYKGETLTVRQWAAKLGLSDDGMRTRLRDKTLTEDELFDSKLTRKAGRPESTYTHEGVTKTLHEWSQETGITVDTMRYRIKHGMTPEQVLSPHKLHSSKAGKSVSKSSKKQ